jgi:2-polyprenyl-3-methyl-5-hydroxy-6-metoxy-1,4-benzoquinol methylase
MMRIAGTIMWMDCQMSSEETEYTDEFAAGLELIWGEGFLSPGGEEEVSLIVQNLDLADKNILDIGSGLGGPATCLAYQHKARRVIGIDIEPLNVRRATAYAEKSGFADKLEFQAVDGGELPFEPESFDLVFSKDAITEAPNKTEIFHECFRILRPGGWLAMSDWFRSPDSYTPEMIEWLKDVGVTLKMATIDQTSETLAALGFLQVEIVDRTEWYQDRVSRERQNMAGKDRTQFERLLGKKGLAEWIASQKLQEAVAAQGQLRPGHIRGRKPGH